MVAPARGHINPVQEVAAFTEAVLNGFTSRKHVANSFGQDIEDIDEDNAIDQERARLLGLRYPVYPGLDFKEVLSQSLAEDDEDIEIGVDENGDVVDATPPPATAATWLTRSTISVSRFEPVRSHRRLKTRPGSGSRWDSRTCLRPFKNSDLRSPDTASRSRSLGQHPRVFSLAAELKDSRSNRSNVYVR
ncbi:hypothetical protein ASF70_12950 [Rhizobium sp. Leaf321]|uniref:hypothetical protein n=1 Tax=Rhizobium sp. Leaf321 TaxID=1736335 RepID=UPI000714E94B|nr:hypothetical protein [Rhizobium sp. Leaf321]KQQ72432.1 hypothetical protein ASF70_12950 [Rhizobium sp. Leaf321]